MKTKRRSSAAKVAEYLGWDIADVTPYRYQPNLFHSPQVFAFEDFYICASEKEPPYKMENGWTRKQNFRGETVWISLVH